MQGSILAFGDQTWGPLVLSPLTADISLRLNHGLAIGPQRDESESDDQR